MTPGCGLPFFLGGHRALSVRAATVPQGLWEVMQVMQEWSITLRTLQRSPGAKEGTGEV